VVIVTGANCGIGYETALDMAKRGAQVILACRDQKRAEDACERIKQQTSNENVKVEQLDLTSLQSVREFVDRFKKSFSRLDILINNAGRSY
jgi:NAD(P)-dependent dehydrogenase (short-subunit alcohol dehydrogenase family)